MNLHALCSLLLIALLPSGLAAADLSQMPVVIVSDETMETPVEPPADWLGKTIAEVIDFDRIVCLKSRYGSKRPGGDTGLDVEIRSLLAGARFSAPAQMFPNDADMEVDHQPLVIMVLKDGGVRAFIMRMVVAGPLQVGVLTDDGPVTYTAKAD